MNDPGRLRAGARLRGPSHSHGVEGTPPEWQIHVPTHVFARAGIIFILLMVTMKTRSLHVVDWRPRSPRCLFQGKSLMTDEHEGLSLEYVKKKMCNGAWCHQASWSESESDGR